ncbi:MAG: hypothetical protein JAY85_14090, partial [Candidatus Thiodiazotropha weberae]|nr:hypothetical protein [Candidatus Thiodiazotropha weberae]
MEESADDVKFATFLQKFAYRNKQEFFLKTLPKKKKIFFFSIQKLITETNNNYYDKHRNFIQTKILQ